MMTLRLLTPAVIDGVQHQVYDEVEVSDDDADTLWLRGWGVPLTLKDKDVLIARQQHIPQVIKQLGPDVSSGTRPVARLVPDPNKDKE